MTLPAVHAAPRRDGLPDVDGVGELPGHVGRRIAGRMEVDAATHRDRRDGDRLVARDGTRASHRLRLRVEVLDDVDIGEGVDLRRDRVADPVPRPVLGTRAVDLGEVDLRAADERGLGQCLAERAPHRVHQAGPRRLGRRRRARVGVDHEHPRHRRPAGERGRQGRELGGVLLQQVQRDLQARADRAGRLLRGLERLAPVVTVEAYLDAHVRGGERAEQLALAGVGPVVIAVLAEPDRGHAGTGRLPDGQPYRAFAAGACGDVDGCDHEALAPLLARLERRRPAEGDRRRVRLEVRVGPVAVILRLPQVALELEQQPPACRELDLESVVGGEERAVGAVHERLHADLVGERPFELPVLGPGAKAGALRLPPRVMDADPDPVVRQHVLRPPVEDDLDAAALARR